MHQNLSHYHFKINANANNIKSYYSVIKTNSNLKEEYPLFYNKFNCFIFGKIKFTC